MQVMESEPVELESPAVIAQLLMAWPAPPSRRCPVPRAAALPPREELAPKRRSRSRVCSCGECARCRDNARWNRVFEEKFADPSYYRGTVVRHNSSLAGA